LVLSVKKISLLPLLAESAKSPSHFAICKMLSLTLCGANLQRQLCVLTGEVSANNS